jgi:hypothetical protein
LAKEWKRRFRLESSVNSFRSFGSVLSTGDGGGDVDAGTEGGASA